MYVFSAIVFDPFLFWGPFWGLFNRFFTHPCEYGSRDIHVDQVEAENPEVTLYLKILICHFFYLNLIPRV